MTRSLLPALLLLTACKDEAPDSAAGVDTAPAVIDDDGDGVPFEEDCDDDDDRVFPGNEETPYDGVDNDCDPATPDDDLDGDGYPQAEDCDDADASFNPEAAEVCDGLDQDCDGEADDGVTTTWWADADADGYGDATSPVEACEVPSGYVDNDQDCDDTTNKAFPDNTEICDEIDNDCDGLVDEEVTTTFYADLDDDGFGDWQLTAEACTLPTGYSEVDTDCDDASAEVNPGATELCNGVDDDCDGAVDEDDADDVSAWYDDDDGDGYGDPDASTVACDAPSGAVADNSDCDDSDASLNPDTVWYLDFDADGYGTTDYTFTQCEQPSGYVLDGSDCDDGDATSNPSGTEVCDEADNDCDGTVDEDATDAETWYDDSDGDGYGDASVTTLACDAPTGTVDDDSDCDDSDADLNHDDADGDGTTSCDGDCDDDDADVSPSEAEACDGVDNDCDGTVDNDSAVYGDAASCAGVSCDDILSTRSSSSDGIYWIDPTGSGGAFEVTCDMTTDGGGWTQVISSNQTEVRASDPPDLTYNSAVWTGSGYGSAGDDTHISDAWSDTPSFSELMIVEDGTATTETSSTSGDLEDWSKTTGTIYINALFSHSYGDYGGRLFTGWAYAICNTANASTDWGGGLGPVRSCQHSFGTLYYEHYTYSDIELWIR